MTKLFYVLRMSSRVRNFENQNTNRAMTISVLSHAELDSASHVLAEV